MLPLLALHTLANQRGDGLRPELLALLRRHADGGLSARIEPDPSSSVHADAAVPANADAHHEGEEAVSARPAPIPV